MAHGNLSIKEHIATRISVYPLYSMFLMSLKKGFSELQ